MKYDMNDTRTPRERIGDPLLRQMMEESRVTDKAPGGCPICESGMRGAPRRVMSVASRPVSMVGQTHCGGEGYTGWGLREHPLAMAYSPLQVWRQVYDADDGLGRGTIFAELDLPFGADEARGGGRYE